jgi:hypothetical protein
VITNLFLTNRVAGRFVLKGVVVKRTIPSVEEDTGGA